MQRWLTMSAAALGRAIAKGDIDPVDLAQTYLDAIDAHPFRSRIYTIVTRDRALAEAQAASERARLGQRKSALDGVPVSWKDLFDSANVATEAGSVLLENRTPTADCEVLRCATSWAWFVWGKRICPNWPSQVWGITPERRPRLV